MNCLETRELLLDYVYEALEDKEAFGVADHLKACGECGKALDGAQANAALLAEAARLDGSGVSFKKPTRPKARPLAHRIAAAVALTVGLGSVALSQNEPS